MLRVRNALKKVEFKEEKETRREAEDYRTFPDPNALLVKDTLECQNEEFLLQIPALACNYYVTFMESIPRYKKQK